MGAALSRLSPAGLAARCLPACLPSAYNPTYRKWLLKFLQRSTWLLRLSALSLPLPLFPSLMQFYRGGPNDGGPLRKHEVRELPGCKFPMGMPLDLQENCIRLDPPSFPKSCLRYVDGQECLCLTFSICPLVPFFLPLTPSSLFRSVVPSCAPSGPFEISTRSSPTGASRAASRAGWARPLFSHVVSFQGLCVRFFGGSGIINS